MSVIHSGLQILCEDLDFLRNALSYSGFRIREEPIEVDLKLENTAFSERFLNHIKALAEVSGASSSCKYVSRLEQKQEISSSEI